jgi:TraM recognition site of TraD and TraG
LLNIFDNLYRGIFRNAFADLNYLLSLIQAWHSAWFFVAGFLALAGLLCGKRLQKVNHPDHPLLSPIIRGTCGYGLFWIGTLLTGFFILLSITIALLTFLGASARAMLEGSQQQWPMVQSYLLQVWTIISSQAEALIGGIFFGLVIGLLLVLRFIPLAERGRGLRDIKFMQKLFSKMRTYAPLDYVNFMHGIFMGLEDGKKPVYVPLHQFRETHAQVLGASGSGKGIALGLLGFQFVQAGECVIAFDPKGDKRLTIILAAAAGKAGVKFHHLDLNPTAPPQFNLLAGMKAHDIEELMVGGLGLEPSAGEGNYYRGIDQDAAEAIARRADSLDNLSLPALLDLAQGDEGISKADNFVRRLRQVCQLPVIQTTHDIDLAGAISRGDVIYVRGSTDNHRVKTLQTMLLIRILQIIKASGGSSHVALILDEFKHLLCGVSLDALGTVRELGAHALLAHQSMGDLGMCAGLRREDVEPRVVDNTTLKLVYRINDAKTSANFAALSGKQRTHVESIRGLDDERQDQRTWTESQEFAMSEDLFTRLHRPSDGREVVAAGVLFGFKAARLVAVSPIQTKGNAPSVVAAPTESMIQATTPEGLI